MSKYEKQMRSQRPLVPVFVAFAILVWIIGWTVRDYALANAGRGWQESAQRGDFLGGYAGLTSLAGTLMLFSAFLLQARELRLQMEELKENREVAKQQANALKEQVYALEEQQMELKEQNRIARQRDDRTLILALSGRVEGDIRGGALWTRVTKHAFDFIVRRALTDLRAATELFELFAGTVDWRNVKISHELDVVMVQRNDDTLRDWMPGLKDSVIRVFSEQTWKENFVESVRRHEGDQL